MNLTYQNIINKIKNKKIKIAIVGLGYVGLPLSIAFCKQNFSVHGFDNDKKRVNLLKKAESYISTISNSELKKNINKNFTVSNNFNLIKSCDVIIICVPTPINRNKTPNLRYVKSAVNQIIKNLRKGHVVISECTTYPGNTEEYLVSKIDNKNLKIGVDVFLGYSPEREDPGNKKYSILKKNIPKIVSGKTDKCKNILKKIYKTISNKIFVAKNIRTAEFTKLFENIYRSVNIGLVNEMKAICDRIDVDFMNCLEGAKTKPFGFNAFYPGIGVGGHCIPVDPYYLFWKAKKHNLKAKFIKLAGEINDRKPFIIANKLLQIIKKKKIKKNNKILILGISYKKNSDDLRNSPALLIHNVLKEKTKIKPLVCDPLIKKNIYNIVKKVKFINHKDIYKKQNTKKFKLIIILTNHDIFDYKFIEQNYSEIIDCTNTFSNNHNNKIITL